MINKAVALPLATPGEHDSAITRADYRYEKLFRRSNGGLCQAGDSSSIGTACLRLSRFTE